MLLFIGEIIHGGRPHTLQTPTEKTNSGEWCSIRYASVLIKYCDLSPSKNNLVSTGGYIVGVSGNPVIPGHSTTSTQSIENIGQALFENCTKPIKQANGVFCGFHVSKQSDQVRLFTDYLGLRKIFLNITPDRTIFSNTQWLIEAALGKTAVLEPQALVEIGVLGHTLDQRTRLRDVVLLEPGKVLCINANGSHNRINLTDITSTASSRMSEADALHALHDAWRDAVEDRMGADIHQYAFLSGGMDSRLLVHTLKSSGGQPRTANFAPHNTRDRVFAEMTAKSMDVPIWLHATGSLNIDVVTDTVKTWMVEDAYGHEFKDSPRVWTGDGGSVGLGHVYLDDETTRLASEENFIACAQRFCRINNRKPVERAYRDNDVDRRFSHSIANLMEEYGHIQPSRSPFYFLMLNDQRHHLNRHFESIHKRGFDYELPFFDRRIIELVASLPGEWFNLHRMYDKLFSKINGSINQTPWQTYPGHVPCQIPSPPGLGYQWSGSFYTAADLRQRQRTKAWQCLTFAMLPSRKPNIFNKGYIGLAAVLTLLGVTDRSYVFECIAPAQN